ncbi:multicopper oxidase family protein [Catelliglobosispora koreensis]|uniref:multicopper oxidase family protein n=1 Tax=Catelliglobosispora koreensis TaxID=129052 RepID=UPI00036B1FAF|nr:multicopper oxidase family protein [Catelliglobosispora koreensis]
MISRRTLLRGGISAAGLGLTGFATLEGCTSQPAPDVVAPSGPQVAAAEAARNPGTIRTFALTAQVSDVDLGGTVVSTWSYGGAFPGTPIRVTAGEQIKARLSNQLPADTSIHWHGLALRNDADGVPHVTQEPIAAGETFTYQFTAPDPGTFWFHPHTGVQQDRGLYAPLIVDDPHEPWSYDAEWIVVLDDWLDGVGGNTPDAQLAQLRQAGHAGGHMMGGASSPLLGGNAGDVVYPHYLINGRLPADPDVFTGKPGQRLRIRFINAGSDTAFRVALSGHALTVTHTDGFAVNATNTDALLIGMGERYDVLVTLADGVFPLVALAEGKNATGRALVRTGAGSAPPAAARPAELSRRVVGYGQLRAAPPVSLPERTPQQTITLTLTGGMMNYDWRFDNKVFAHDKAAHVISSGERVRVNYLNTTMMWHPVHLHGHTFALGDPGGPRKDTAIVLPGRRLTTFFDAVNPGQWMIHCHNAYHAEAGMMTLLGYRA